MKDEQNSFEGIDHDFIPSLAALAAFERAATHGSFAQAAADLGRTPSAISHAISDLEARFGCRLFNRVGRSVELTEGGRKYLADVRQAMRILSRGGKALTGWHEDQIIRLSVPPLFMSTVLIPGLDDFQRAHPELELRIEAGNAFVDWSSQDFDAEVRLCGVEDPSLHVVPLATVSAVPVCSPKLVEGRNGLRKIADLTGSTLIHHTQKPFTWPKWLREVGHGDLVAKRNLTFSSAIAGLDAARRGLGVAFAIYPLVKRYPGFGQELVIPFGKVMHRAASYQFVCRPDSARLPKIAAVRDWLQRTSQRFLDSVDIAYTPSEHTAKPT